MFVVVFVGPVNLFNTSVWSIIGVMYFEQEKEESKSPTKQTAFVCLILLLLDCWLFASFFFFSITDCLPHSESLVKIVVVAVRAITKKQVRFETCSVLSIMDAKLEKKKNIFHLFLIWKVVQHHFIEVGPFLLKTG